MELFKIKHRYTKEILFQGEFESFRDCVETVIKLEIDFSKADFSGMDLSEANFSRDSLSGANFSGALLSEANFSRADLSGSNFYRADLSGSNFSGSLLAGANFSRANLSGADFSWADLSGVNLSGSNFSQVKMDKIAIDKIPIQISGLKWNVIIFDNYMRVGCELHKFSEWESFSDERINEMNLSALDFWKKNKQFLLSACAANGRG